MLVSNQELNKVVSNFVNAVQAKETELSGNGLSIITDFLDDLIRNGHQDTDGRCFEVNPADLVDILRDKALTQLLGNNANAIQNHIRDTWLTNPVNFSFLSYSGLQRLSHDLRENSTSLSVDDRGILEAQNALKAKLVELKDSAEALSSELGQGFNREQHVQKGFQAIIQEMKSQFSSNDLIALANTVDESSHALFVYQLKILDKIPRLISNEDLESGENAQILEKFTQGDFSSIDLASRKKVLGLLHKLANGGELDAYLKLEFETLAKNEKLYLEYVRQNAQQIHDINNDSSQLMNNLLSKVPQLLVPGAIGAVLMSLFGGSAMMGVVAAVGIHLLGETNSTGEQPREKLTPPKILQAKATESTSPAATNAA
jgi:hypothetical protein